MKYLSIAGTRKRKKSLSSIQSLRKGSSGRFAYFHRNNVYGRPRGSLFFVVVGTFFAFVFVLTIGVLLFQMEYKNKTPGPDSGSPDISIIPPPPDVVLLFQASGSKEPYLTKMIQSFNQAGFRTQEGANISVELVGNGESGFSQYGQALYSPAHIQWLDDAEKAMEMQLVSNRSTHCVTVLQNPFAYACWKEEAEAAGWPYHDFYMEDFENLLNDGWAFYNHSDWGPFHVGHSNPHVSNSGAISLLFMVYSYDPANHPPGELTPEDVWQKEVVEGLRFVFSHVSYLGIVDAEVLEDMVKYGPDFIDCVPTSENKVLQVNRVYAQKLQDEWNQSLAVVYPTLGTFWDDHPFCILDLAPWTTAEDLEAAQIFLDFVQGEQSINMLKADGFRAVLPNGTHVYDDSVLNYDLGVDPTVTTDSLPPLSRPGSETMAEIIKLWDEVKRPAVVCVAIDSSRSMNGKQGFGKIKESAQGFLDRLSDKDFIRLVEFNSKVQVLASGKLGDIRDIAKSKIEGMAGNGIGAKMHGAFNNCFSFHLSRMTLFQPVNWTYVIVVVTDGNGDDYLQEWSVTESNLDKYHSFPTPYQLRVFPILYDTGGNTNLIEGFFNGFLRVGHLVGTSGKVYINVTDDTIDAVYHDIWLHF